MTSLRNRSINLLAAGGFAVALLGGGMAVVEVGNPDANPGAKKLHAVLVARVAGCIDAAKSAVSAHAVRLEGGKVQRTGLGVVRLAEPGVFAITGPLPPAERVAIEVAVTNSGGREPGTLVRLDGGTIQWGSLKRFNGTSPTDADVRAVLESGTEVSRIH